MIDSSHQFTFEIRGSDVTDYVDWSSVSMRDSEGSEIDTLTLELVDRLNTLTMRVWDEVTWTADGTTTLFGGYVIKAMLQYLPGGVGRKFALTCESYVTRLHRVELQPRTWVGETPGQIVADLFDDAGLSDFDASRHVATGTALPSFAVEGTEKMPSVLDRLAALNGWVWRVDGDKALWFGPAEDDPAPFRIADEKNCDYSLIFPAQGGSVSFGVDGSELINRVVVIGGTKPSPETTDNFTGDGSTKRFLLSHQNIIDIYVTVNGELWSDGTDWWHDYTERQVLINYREGWIEFENAPAVGAAIAAVYLYEITLKYEQSDAASITTYGVTLTRVVIDRAITTQEQAQLVAQAILDTYANGVTTGTLTTLRLGIRAGQSVSLKFSDLGVDDVYVVRGMSIAIAPSRDWLECTLQVGGPTLKLSTLIGTFGTPDQTEAVLQKPEWPTQETPVGEVRVGQNGVILAIDPRTQWVPPA